MSGGEHPTVALPSGTGSPAGPFPPCPRGKAPEADLERFRGWIEGRPRRGPESVHVDLANACNLACLTCWNHAQGLTVPKPPEWKARRMDPDRFRALVVDLAALGVERVLLGGGGEPFTHPAIYEFLLAVKTCGMRLTVLTNGTLCDWDRVRALEVDQILLNVSAGCAATYEATHPGAPPGAFERLGKAVVGLRDAVGFNLVQVIHGRNHREMPAMVRLAAELGARVSFKVAEIPSGAEAHALDPEGRRQVLEEGIPGARRAAAILGVRHNLDAFKAQFTGPEGHGPEPPCFAGHFYGRVQVDGRAFFCCESIPVGHLDEAPYREIWDSEAYNSLRDRLRRGMPFPGCARCGKHDLNFSAARRLRHLREGGLLP